MENSKVCKDLTMLAGIQIKRTVIVDDSPAVSTSYPRNALKVSEWTGDILD